MSKLVSTVHRITIDSFDQTTFGSLSVCSPFYLFNESSNQLGKSNNDREVDMVPLDADQEPYEAINANVPYIALSMNHVVEQHGKCHKS